MKKGWKIFAIVCGCTAGAGVILCIAALMFGVTWQSVSDELADGVGVVVRESKHTPELTDWDDDWEHSAKWKNAQILSGDFEKTYYHVEDLSVELSAGTMEIISYDGNEIVLEGKAVNEALRTRCSVKDGTLEFKTSNKVWKENGLNDKEAGSYILYVPETLTLEEINITAGAGELTVRGITSMEMELNLGAGNTVLTDIGIDDTEVRCGAGNVDLNGKLQGDINIECGVGNVTMTLEGKKTDYNYDIATGIGGMHIAGTTYGTLDRSVNEDNGAPYTIEMTGGVGEVEISFQEAS